MGISCDSDLGQFKVEQGTNAEYVFYDVDTREVYDGSDLSLNEVEWIEFKGQDGEYTDVMLAIADAYSITLPTPTSIQDGGQLFNVSGITIAYNQIEKNGYFAVNPGGIFIEYLSNVNTVRFVLGGTNTNVQNALFTTTAGDSLLGLRIADFPINGVGSFNGFQALPTEDNPLGNQRYGTERHAIFAVGCNNPVEGVVSLDVSSTTINRVGISVTDSQGGSSVTSESVTVETSEGDSVEVTSGGVSVESSEGDSVEITSEGVTIEGEGEGEGSTTIDSEGVSTSNVDADTVNIGGVEIGLAELQEFFSQSPALNTVTTCTDGVITLKVDNAISVNRIRFSSTDNLYGWSKAIFGANAAATNQGFLPLISDQQFEPLISNMVRKPNLVLANLPEQSSGLPVDPVGLTLTKGVDFFEYSIDFSDRFGAARIIMEDPIPAGDYSFQLVEGVQKADTICVSSDVTIGTQSIRISGNDAEKDMIAGTRDLELSSTTGSVNIASDLKVNIDSSTAVSEGQAIGVDADGKVITVNCGPSTITVDVDGEGEEVTTTTTVAGNTLKLSHSDLNSGVAVENAGSEGFSKASFLLAGQGQFNTGHVQKSTPIGEWIPTTGTVPSSWNDIGGVDTITKETNSVTDFMPAAPFTHTYVSNWFDNGGTDLSQFAITLGGASIGEGASWGSGSSSSEIAQGHGTTSDSFFSRGGGTTNGGSTFDNFSYGDLAVFYVDDDNYGVYRLESNGGTGSVQLTLVDSAGVTPSFGTTVTIGVVPSTYPTQEVEVTQVAGDLHVTGQMSGPFTNLNGGGALNIWAGTQDEFDAITEVTDGSVIYIIRS